MALRQDNSSLTSSGGRVGGGAFPVVIQVDPSRNPTMCSSTSSTSMGCLLCATNIIPITYSGSIAERYNNVFVKLCEVLKVNLTPFSFNFSQDPFPFCSQCAGMIFSLYEFHEKLKEIEKCVDKTVSQVKATIKCSDRLKASSISSDVRTVIFRAQILKDLETWNPENSTSVQQEQGAEELNKSISENSQTARSPKKGYRGKRATQGLVYNPSKTSSPAASQVGTSRSQNEVTPATTSITTINSMPALVAVSALQATNDANSEKEALCQSFSSSVVADTTNVAEENSHEGTEVDLKQILRAVEVYPTTSSDCSPAKSSSEIISLDYVAANETVSQTGESVSQSTDICVEVTPTQVPRLDDDFEPYHDDSQNDVDFNESEDDEENKEAVSRIEQEVNDGNNPDYVLENSPTRKRKGFNTPVSKASKRKKLLFDGAKQSVKTEAVEFESEVEEASKKVASKSIARERKRKQKAECNKYVSLIETDSQGRMFYEGILLKTHLDKPKVVSCGECGKMVSSHSNLSGNKKYLIMHIRTHHLDEWHDGEKLHKRTRAPPISYVSMLEKHEGRVFFRGHEIIGSEGSVGFSCGTCGKTFTGRCVRSTNRQLLIDHIRGEHLGEKFYCDQCDASYTNKGSLADHKLTKHVQGQLECDICGKRMLKKHFGYHRYSHMNEEEKKASIAAGTAPSKVLYRKKPGMCNVCGKLMFGVEALKNHEKAHLEETQECNVCGKQINSARMNKHMQRVHSKNPDRGAQCPWCYKFTHDLKNHVKTHTPKAERQDLKRRIPSELPFECSFCGFKSESEEKNNQHEAANHRYGATKIKENYKFSCDFCSKRYLCRRSRRRHQVSVHPKEHAAARLLTLSKNSATSSLTKKTKVSKPKEDENDFSKMGRHLDLDISEGATAEIETSETGELSFLTVGITKVTNGYKCGMCNGVVAKKGIDETRFIRHHIRAYHLGEFQCDTCKKFFDKLSALNKHKKAHAVSLCPVCQRPTVKKFLSHHLWTHKSQEEKQAVIDAGYFSKIPVHIRHELGIPIAKFDVDCNVCGLTLPNKTQLEKHQRAEHPETKKFWNDRKHRNRKSVGRRRSNINQDFSDEEDEFSLSETTETDISDVEDTDEQISKPQLRKRVDSLRNRSYKSENRRAPTSRESRSPKPCVSATRLPEVILSAKKFTIVNDETIHCTFSDGEVREMFIEGNAVEHSTAYFEIDDHGSASEYSEFNSSGDEDDFAVIPDSDTLEVDSE